MRPRRAAAQGRTYWLRRCRANDPIFSPLFIFALRQAFEDAPEAFFNLSDEELTAPGGRIAIICDHRGRVVAGARAVIENSRAHVGQCFCGTEHRGQRLVDAAVAALRVDLHDLLGIAEANLVIRVSDDGRDNEPAARAYQRVGFRRGGTEKIVLDPNNPAHAHFFPSTPGGILFVREMDADGASLLECRRLMVRAFHGMFG
jgi:RimJ/RimL family protein N-acetyltransferase